MTVIIPGMNSDNERICIRPKNVSDGLMQGGWWPPLLAQFLDQKLLTQHINVPVSLPVGTRDLTDTVPEPEHAESDQAPKQDAGLE